MAKERLSKLQKWILKRLFKSDNSWGNNKKAIWVQEIVWEYPFWKNKLERKILNKYQVSVSRTIRKLYEKGFIGLLNRGIYSKEFKEDISEELYKGILSEYRQVRKRGSGFQEIETKEDLNLLNPKIKSIYLTEKGILKAKELLKLSPDK